MRRARGLPRWSPARPPGVRLPGLHTRARVPLGSSPHVRGRAERRAPVEAREAHVVAPALTPGPTASSPRSPAAAAATPARLAPSPPPLPTAGSALHPGSRARPLAPPRPLPSRSPPPSSRCHVCQSMRTTPGEGPGDRCLLGLVVLAADWAGTTHRTQSGKDLVPGSWQTEAVEDERARSESKDNLMLQLLYLSQLAK